MIIKFFMLNSAYSMHYSLHLTSANTKMKSRNICRIRYMNTVYEISINLLIYTKYNTKHDIRKQMD